MPPHYIEPISRCWLRRTNFLESVLSPPLSLFSASQRMRGAIICLLTCGPTCQWKRKRTHWTCTSFTLTCWWWKPNPINISRVVRFYLQFNPRCTSRGFNYHSIFFHDMTWMLDVPPVGNRRSHRKRFAHFRRFSDTTVCDYCIAHSFSKGLWS